MRDLQDGFFEGALDGCGCVLALAAAFLVGTLIAGLLVRPWFWVLAGVAAVLLLASSCGHGRKTG